ncbi:hypothetical protein H0H92_009284, partial [Tricholoma furcatifolium]
MSANQSAIRYNFRARASTANAGGVLYGSGSGGHGEQDAVSANPGPDGANRRAQPSAAPQQGPLANSALVQHEETSPAFSRETTSVGLTSIDMSREPSVLTSVGGSLPDFPEAQAFTETVHTDFGSAENNILNEEQNNVVNLARAQMSEEQRRMVDERMNSARAEDNDTSSESHDEAGPSQSKGKGTDPRNWGNVDFLGDEVDPE